MNGRVFLLRRRDEDILAEVGKERPVLYALVF